jgi:putative transposase
MIKQEHKNLVSIKRACELSKVSRSGYYEWLRRPEKRGVDVLGQKIKRIFKKSRKTYGTRRIKKQLEAEGIAVSRQRIRRKMAEQGLVAKARRKTRATTNSNHDHPVAPNLLDRQFGVQHPNKVWVMDITYLATSEGWLYLAIVLDLYSRMVVGWSIGKRMTKELVIDALETAVKRRNPAPGLICHSDRGSQYCSHAYRELLQKHGFLCSMSRKGECQDNACANVTLVFSALQALLAARAGASYVSPFIGRIDDTGQEGMDVLDDIMGIVENYQFSTEVIAASIRHPQHVLEAARIGADIATVPFNVLKMMFRHPLTDRGIERFLADWDKVIKG